MLPAFFQSPTPAVAAESGCTLIVSFPDGGVLKRDGACEQRRSPFSTFKFPLAVMGFDAGILHNETSPSWPYKDEYNATSERERKTVDPAVWEKDSIVWFSQNVTRALGPEKFQFYVRQFSYGNEDVSGDAGKDNGLARSWLMSSLLISPVEQISFMKKFLRRDLGVSAHAYDMTKAVIPRFAAKDGWTVHGKTGSGWLPQAGGARDENRPQGWFVGWAEKGDRTVLFAKLLIEDKASDSPAGPKARDLLLWELPQAAGGAP